MILQESEEIAQKKAKNKTKFWLIEGEQLDGEHGYRIFAKIEQLEKPTHDQRQKVLVERHAFGYDEDAPVDFYNFNTYGDGMTAIRHYRIEEISHREFEILEKLRITY